MSVKLRSELSLLSLIIVLSSCARVPDNILEKSNTGGEISGQTENVSRQPDISYGRYMTLRELAGSRERLAEEIKSAKFDNLTFDGDYDLYIPDRLYQRTVTFVDDFSDKSGIIFEHYTPPELAGKTEITDDLKTSPYGPYILDRENNFYCAAAFNGFFSFDIYQNYDIPYSIDAEKTVYAGSSRNESCTDILASADAFIAEFRELTGTDNKYCPGTVSVYNYNGGTFYYLTYDLMWDGIGVFTVRSRRSELSVQPDPDSGWWLLADENGKILTATLQGIIEEYGEQTEIERIVSPVYAARLMSEKLAEYNKFNAVDLKLSYFPVYKGDTETFYRDIPTTKRVIGLEPYWVFVFDADIGKEIIGLVSCTDGSVEFFNNKR